MHENKLVGYNCSAISGFCLFNNINFIAGLFCGYGNSVVGTVSHGWD